MSHTIEGFNHTATGLAEAPSCHGWNGLYEDHSDRNILFGLVIHELQNIGILSAVAGSTLNDLYRTGQDYMPTHLITLIPPDPVAVPLLLRTRRIWRTGPRLIPQIDVMMFYLASAKRLMHKRIGLNGTATALTGVAFEELVDAWRTANGEIWAMFDVLECEPPVPLTAELAASIRKLKTLLVRARDGGSPCLARAGAGLPQWAQKRQRHRVLLNAHASLESRGAVRSIVVVDASSGGLGIDGGAGLMLADPVAIEFEDGRRLDAVVSWINGNRAGVRFTVALAADDPLIAMDPLDAYCDRST